MACGWRLLRLVRLLFILILAKLKYFVIISLAFDRCLFCLHQKQLWNSVTLLLILISSQWRWDLRGRVLRRGYQVFIVLSYLILERRYPARDDCSSNRVLFFSRWEILGRTFDRHLLCLLSAWVDLSSLYLMHWYSLNCLLIWCHFGWWLGFLVNTVLLLRQEMATSDTIVSSHLIVLCQRQLWLFETNMSLHLD